MPRPWFALFCLLCCSVAFGQASEYNAIYKNAKGKIFSRKPNAFLADVTRARKPGQALDVGMGQGRNSIYLARHAWDVTGFDASVEGVRIARAQAARDGVKLSARVATFDEFDFGENAWDLIVLMYAPARDIAPKVMRALKPGGAVVVEDRHRDTRRVWPEGGLFADNELPTLFPGLRVLRYEDFWGIPDWQGEGLQERIVHLIAEKPSIPDPGCLWKGQVVKEGGDVCWDHAARFHCLDGGWVFTHESCK
jgi:SAM-dependent methyltransferase